MDRFLEAQNWLKSLASEAKFFHEGKAPSLDAIRRILEALGNPDQSFQWRVIVGGTAGKGTVCRLTEDVLLRSGKKVCTLMSPNLQVVTERIRIMGQLISPEEFGRNILEVRKVSEKKGIDLTYYEAIVVAGILAGQKAGCEILICEVGVGGEWDAVNSVRGKRIGVLTFVGPDHLDILGPTLADVARTKAGIFTEDSVLNLSYEQKYCSILREVAKSKVVFIKGVKQNLNKKIVRNICEQILGSSYFEMQKIQLPARWEKIKSAEGKNTVILDGAHSRPRFEFILPHIKKLTGKKVGVLTMVKNHDWHSFDLIVKELDEIIWTEVPGERRFWSPELLRQKFQKGTVQKDPLLAFAEAQKRDGTILVTGSFYLCGVIRNLFYPPAAILEQQTEFPKIK